MSRYTLIVQLVDAPGALVRALSLVERRGFRVVDARTEGASSVTVEVEAAGRSLLNLKRQLENLWDVEGVAIGGSG